MARATRISARVSRETKDLFERQARATGVTKGHLVDTALRHHLRALQELPADALVPARIALSRRSFEQVARRLRCPGKPSQELRDLMRGDRD